MDIQCKFCSTPFKSEVPLKSHLQRVHFYCQRCDKQCLNILDFVRHCKEDHKFAHQCQKCKSKFLTLEELKSHEENSHFASLQCELCESKFTTKKSLIKHQIKHSKHRKKLACGTCGKEYLSSDGLKYHVQNSHMGPVPLIKCEFCRYSAKNPKLMNKHAQICGPNVQMYHCDKCEFYVSKQSLLENHKAKKHSTKALVNCEFCSYKSQKGQRMRIHQKICGPDVTMHQCHKCEFKVPTKTLLIFHISKNHRKRFINRQKLARDQVNQSIKHEVFKCHVCEFVIGSEYDLQLHIDRRHGVSKKCDFCDYATKFRHRMEYHLERCDEQAKMYNCESCEYKVSDKSIFNNHIKHKHGKGSLNKCSKCDFQASTPYKLKVHEADKHGEIVNCPNCSYKSIERNVNRHLANCGPNAEMLDCDQCDYKVSSANLLNRHVTESHPNTQKKKCDKCTFLAFNESLLRHHANIVHAVLTKCEFCDFTSKSDMKLKVHLENCGPGVPKLQCQKCSFEVSCKLTLESHTCHKDPEANKIKCEFCDFTIARNQRRMSVHMEKCGPNAKMYNCTKCDFKVSQEGSLLVHLAKMHRTTESNHHCEFCDYTCRDNSSLRKHQNICKVDTPKFICNQCQFKAGTSYLLTLHTFKEHGKQRKCEFCDYTSTNSQSMRKHFETCTKESKKFQCDQCSFRISNSYLLTCHVSKIHGKKTKCDNCDYTSNEPNSLRSHMKSCDPLAPKFYCEQCEFKAGTALLLTLHTIKVHGKKTKCDFCDYNVDDPARLRKHMEKCFVSDERFVCEACELEFTSKYVLNGHKQKHSKISFKYPKKNKEKTSIVKVKEEPFEHVESIVEIKEEPMDLACHFCTFLGNSEIGLNSHKNIEHSEAKGQWIVKIPKLDL